MVYATITAIGSYVPARRLANKEIEHMVETTDEWILRRTGIKERRIAAPDEFASDLAYRAVEDMLHRYVCSLTDIDLVIVSTATPDFSSFPSVAAQVQGRFNLTRAGAFDLSAACAGFEYALHVANGLITGGLNRKILVIATETMSKITDYTDRSTCILFGDGAGAALIEASETTRQFLGTLAGAEGHLGRTLYRAGLSTAMNGKEITDTGKIVQNGRELYKWVVKNVPLYIHELLAKSGVRLSDIDWFVPHSSNLRMIESICERLNYPMEKVLYSLEYYGNTSSATIPISLSKAAYDGKMKRGDLLLLYGFGGGVVHCGQVLQWNL